MVDVVVVVCNYTSLGKIFTPSTAALGITFIRLEVGVLLYIYGIQGGVTIQPIQYAFKAGIQRGHRVHMEKGRC